jgi:hypothetical protein
MMRGVSSSLAKKLKSQGNQYQQCWSFVNWVERSTSWAAWKRALTQGIQRIAGIGIVELKNRRGDEKIWTEKDGGYFNDKFFKPLHTSYDDYKWNTVK